MISVINSRTNKKVVHASKLKDKKSIKEFKEFLIEGEKSLELALQSEAQYKKTGGRDDAFDRRTHG